MEAEKQIGVCRAVPKITCHCETSAHTGRGNPPVRGEMYRKAPRKRKLLRFLVVIVTWFRSTGGLSHQCAHWFAMTALFSVHFQTPICRFAASGRLQKNRSRKGAITARNSPGQPPRVRGMFHRRLSIPTPDALSELLPGKCQ